MNTKPVDVLAVLQMWVDGIRRDFDDRCSHSGLSYDGLDAAESLVEARDAIAELIAAIDEWGVSREAQIRAVGTDGYRAARDRYEAAVDRFDAALARVKGGA